MVLTDLGLDLLELIDFEQLTLGLLEIRDSTCSVRRNCSVSCSHSSRGCSRSWLVLLYKFFSFDQRVSVQLVVLSSISISTADDCSDWSRWLVWHAKGIRIIRESQILLRCLAHVECLLRYIRQSDMLSGTLSECV